MKEDRGWQFMGKVSLLLCTLAVLLIGSDLLLRPHESSSGWSSCTLFGNYTYESCHWTDVRIPFHITKGGDDHYFRGTLHFPQSMDGRTLQLVSDDCIGEIRVHDELAYSDEGCNSGLNEETDHIVTRTFDFGGLGDDVPVAVKVKNRIGSYSPIRFYIIDGRMPNILELLLLMLAVDAALHFNGRPQWIIPANFAVLIALTHLSYPSFPETWGIEVLGRFSQAYSVLMLLLAAAFWFIIAHEGYARRRFSRPLQRLTRRIDPRLPKALHRLRPLLESRAFRIALVAAVLVAIPLLAWQLRTKSFFTDWQQATRYAHEAHYLDIKEPLAYMTLRGFYLLASAHTPGLDSLTANAMLSCIEGGVFVALLYFATKELADRLTHRLTMMAFVMSSIGVLHLYMGDIEMRPTVALALLAFILVGLRYLKGAAGACTLGLVAGIAASTHVSAFFNLLSVPVLLYSRLRGMGRRRMATEAAAFLASFLIPTAAVFGYTVFVANHIQDGSFEDHIRTAIFNLNGQSVNTIRDPSYLFRTKYANEMFNLAVMIAPAAAAVLAYLVVFRLKSLRSASRNTVFLVVLLAGNGLLPIILQESYEWESNWVLYSGFALIMSLAAASWYRESEKAPIWARNTLLVTVWALLLHTIPHVLGNAHIYL